MNVTTFATDFRLQFSESVGRWTWLSSTFMACALVTLVGEDLLGDDPVGIHLG
jgi:hypothetical protein